MSLAHAVPVSGSHFEHKRLTRVWLGHAVSDDERGLLIGVADGSPARDVMPADGRLFDEVPFTEWGRTPKAFDESPRRGDALMSHPRWVRASPWSGRPSDGPTDRSPAWTRWITTSTPS